MQVTDTPLEGLKIVELKVFSDSRGFFMERFNKRVFAEAGLPTEFVQDNHSKSQPGVLRGVHYQHNRPQGKMVGCISGAIFDVAVDLRCNSKTRGQYFGLELTEGSGKMLWVPAGFAHGFCVIGPKEAHVIYKVTEFYNPPGENAILWNDPELRIDWPVTEPLLSPKDGVAGSYRDYLQSDLAQKLWWI